MGVSIEMGVDQRGAAVDVDMEELLATRLLVQGNSGSGKSHLLRRLLEGSAALVQQVVIDPEGDFVSLGEAFGHLTVDAEGYSLPEIRRIAQRVREHRASVVLNLEGLEQEGQMRCAAEFLSALFDASREHWFPALVVVDEAQVFAPAGGGEVIDEVRRASLGAMTNLMCRGRKRGLAGVIATQRLAKLAKNVAAEASNFLMGRTFLDIDMTRAADLLGMERRQAEVIRDLARGEFLALGPALSRRAVMIRIGDVRTASRSGGPMLLPLPERSSSQAELLAPVEPGETAPPPTPSRPVPVEALTRAMRPAAVPELASLSDAEVAGIAQTVIEEIVSDAGARTRSVADLFTDFQVRCRMRGVSSAPLDRTRFNRRLAMAKAGVGEGEGWDQALALGESLPEEMLGVFLTVARAAKEGAECPSDDDIAEVYGTSSLSRARWLLSYLEDKGILAIRVDLGGKRAVSLPHLGWTTAPAFPSSSSELRPVRPARRK
jgi:hypothetical protein